MRFGAGLTSGQAMSSPRLRALLGLVDGEVSVCCVNLGTVTKGKGPARSRPSPSTILTVLDGGAGHDFS